MSLIYPVNIKQIEDYYLVTCRDIPELITEGVTFKHALYLAQAALIDSLSFYDEKEMDYPEPSAVQDGEFLVYI